MHLTASINLTKRVLLALGGSLLIALALATTAQAAPRDANRDGLPDRWEHKYKLSLKVDQSRKDQDHDGVANVCELQSHTSPRRKDSDRDGRRDGAEDHDRDGVNNGQESRGRSDCGDRDSDDDGVRDDNESAGEIVSFENGVLTIKTFAGETVSGTVDATTKIECGCDDNEDDATQSPAPNATAAREDDDDATSDDDTGETEGDHHSSGGDAGSSSNSDDREHGACGVDSLVAGATVHEATLVDGVFVKVQLAG